jgi:hypothetical protein
MPVRVVHRAPQHLEQVAAVRAGVVRNIPAVQLCEGDQWDRILDQLIQIQGLGRVELGPFFDGQEVPACQRLSGVGDGEDLAPAAHGGRCAQVVWLVCPGVVADWPRLVGRPQQRPTDRAVRNGRSARPGMQAASGGGMSPQLREERGYVQGARGRGTDHGNRS